MWVKDYPRWFSLYHNIVSMQVDIRWLLWRLYDSRCILLWWMCSTVRDYTLLIKYLCVTWCGSIPLDCSYVLLWIDIVVFYFVLITLKTINSLVNDYQRDEWLKDKDFPDGKWFRTSTLLGHMSILEEWFLYHSMVWVTYLASCLITQMKHGFERWCNWWWWWCSWSSHEIV